MYFKNSIIATTLMIKNISTTAGEKFIHISWSTPKFLPMSYRIRVSCLQLWNGIEYRCTTLNATQFDTFHTVTQLAPSSKCVFTLFAIYNPASIDRGITRTVLTMKSSKCCTNALLSVVLTT